MPKFSVCRRIAPAPKRRRRSPEALGLALAGLAGLAALAAAAAPSPASAFDVIATSPARYALGVSADIFTIAAVFDATPALPPDASAIRVAGVESGIHFGSFEISGDSLLWHNLSTPFFPGEMVNVNYRRDITSVAGDSLLGGHYFAFTVASGPGTAIWSPRVGYRGADVPYFLYGGDLDEDGTPDLAVPNENTDDVSTFLNPYGSGYFPQRVDYTVGNMPSSCFGEDLDNDGYQDIATADILGNSVSVLLNEGDGTFAPAVSYASGNRCRQVFGGDFDGDNDIDLCSTSNLTDQVYLFYNNGDGTYAPGVTYSQVQDAPFSVETGDFNLDGHLDIAVASQMQADSVAIMTNNGVGAFTTTSRFHIGDNPWESSCNDLDGDGDPDLTFVVSTDDSMAFAFNDGTGAFPVITKRKTANGGFPLASFVADVDGDGDIDAIASNYSAGSVRVFVNNGAGVFTINATLQVRVSGSYTWAHDLDGDGDLDLSVADELADSIFVFYNGSSPATDVGDGADHEGASAPAAPALALWPNPVRAGSAANLRLRGLSGIVDVDVYSVDGRKVRRLWSGPVTDGAQLAWDGRDASGRVVASGRYFVAAANAERTVTREVHIVR